MSPCAWILVLSLYLHISSALDREPSAETVFESDRLANIQAEGEAAVITVGIVEAMKAVPELGRYLESHPGYAAEFRTFGRNVVALANTYLGRSQKYIHIISL